MLINTKKSLKNIIQQCDPKHSCLKDEAAWIWQSAQQFSLQSIQTEPKILTVHKNSFCPSLPFALLNGIYLHEDVTSMLTFMACIEFFKRVLQLVRYLLLNFVFKRIICCIPLHQILVLNAANLPNLSLTLF